MISSARKMLGPLLVLIASVVVCAADAPKSRPNVVFIIVDDLSTSLGCYGHPLVQSPNIDRLAGRGVRFDRAYVQYPVCNPSRTSFLTGLRPETTRVLNNNTNFRANLPSAITLPELFHNSGYFVAGVGKIVHDGFDDPKMWDVALTPVATEAGEQGEGAILQDKGRMRTWCRWREAEGTDEDQPDGQTVRESIRLIRENAGKPFFLAVGLRRPHDPWVAPKKYFDLYPPEKIHLPEDPADRSALLPMAHTAHNMKGQLTLQQARELIRAYYACISFMDAQVGKLLDFLDQQKLTENTIIVFIGDHGWHEGDHDGLWLKATLFEQTTRVPFIVVAPGAAHGAVSPALIELVDLYPTLAELAGLTAPDNLEGTSFVPLLKNPAQSWKQAAFTVVSRGNSVGRTVRTDRWRYTEWPDGSAELYDHDSDPREYRNLIKNEARAPVIAELKQTLARGWRAAKL